ncbi:hypothetical protein [Niabella beijingensis]|uniref:hypothetical protein n=1 Tax=Niabella beijingensis TaxID=2872700 RepID=UPI001CC0A819|nr:hypothetical protein [Niabella beijingensis]MBZ4189461.1 hypothetical protein [Niabella beijingensis]
MTFLFDVIDRENRASYTSDRKEFDEMLYLFVQYHQLPDNHSEKEGFFRMKRRDVNRKTGMRVIVKSMKPFTAGHFRRMIK